MRFDVFVLGASFLCFVPDRVPHTDEPAPITRLALQPGRFVIERIGSSVRVIQSGKTVVQAQAVYLGDSPPSGFCRLDASTTGLRLNGRQIGEAIEFDGGGLSVRSVSVPPGGVVVMTPSVKFEWRR